MEHHLHITLLNFQMCHAKIDQNNKNRQNNELFVPKFSPQYYTLDRLEHLTRWIYTRVSKLCGIENITSSVKAFFYCTEQHLTDFEDQFRVSSI